MKRSLLLSLVLTLAVVLLFPGSFSSAAGASSPIASLQVEDEEGNLVHLPLQHTEVRGELSGFVARVEVIQTYGNPFDEPIEATYVFPLPERAAVDDFVMEIGSRTVRGEIHRREEARRIYETARASGYTASLLEQERPNIFTQSVANILPGDEIRIHIRYVDVLPYEEGSFRFLFPMVVGPRFIPGGAGTPDAVTVPAALDGGEADLQAVVPAASRSRDAVYQPPDRPTDIVPDAKRINPPVLRPEFRSGHDISLTLEVETAVPIGRLVSDSHSILVDWPEARKARVSLAPGDRLPNKDFMLRIDVAQELPEVGVIAHRTGDDGFFALRLQPKAEIQVAEAAPKEILFVLDQSGSMNGLPIKMSKKFMVRALKTLGPDDHFNIIRFSSTAKALAPKPLPRTEESVELGLRTVRSMEARGGTYFLKALQEALRQPHDPGRIRIIFFLSDGFIGNEQQIFDAIRNQVHDARVFTLGIGSSVNHYLLREMAALGNGAYQYIRPDGDEEEAVERFHGWVTLPYLTDLEIDWGGLAVEDLQPSRLPDLFSGQTLTVVGRYLWGGDETVIVRGRLGGRKWETQVPVHLPEQAESHGALASVWARHRIRDLLLEGPSRPEIEYQVTSLALSFRLMSPFTSFVAVDDSEVVNPDGNPLQVKQALPLPEFVSFEDCFGDAGPRAARPDEMLPAEEQDSSGAVRVEVHDAEGPARAARVLLFRSSTSGATDLLTGHDGVARFDDLTPGGGYRLMVLHRGALFDSTQFDVKAGMEHEILISTIAAVSPAPMDAGAQSVPAPKMPQPVAKQSIAGAGTGKTAILTGQIVDRQGQPMPDVTVTAVSRRAATQPIGGVTDAAGRYHLSPLQPSDDYILTVDLAGFATVEISPIELAAGHTTTQNVTLVPSAMTTERITVVARGDIVDVASSQTFTVFHSEFVTGLPTIGRSSRDILALAPGVTDADGGGNPNVSGARAISFQARFDGVNTTTPVTGTFGHDLNLESIAQIEVITTGASAEFTQAQGGFAHILSKKPAGKAAAGVTRDVLARLIPAGAARVVEPALRVLADLSTDRRLSRAEGVPALVGLLGAQDPQGRIGRSLTEHALATWALVEAARSYPDLPWLQQATQAAVAELRAAGYGHGEWPAVRGARADRFTSELAKLVLAVAGVRSDGSAPANPQQVSTSLSDLKGTQARLGERIVAGLEKGLLGLHECAAF